MRRPWFGEWLLIASCVFVPNGAQSQSTQPSGTVQTDAGNSPQALLIRSYIDSQQLTPEERAMALQFLARSAGSIEPAYNRLWSEELFFLAFRLPRNWNRLAFEKNALEALATTDPIRAMQLFGQLEDPIPLDSGKYPEDVRAFAARTVFPAYWKQKGPDGFDEIRAKAQFLGSTGEYPYAAAGWVARELANAKDVRAEILLGDAVSRFGQGSRFDNTNRECVEFLDGAWEFLSAALKRQAVVAVVGLLTQPTPSSDFIYRGSVRAKTGAVDFTDQNQQLLFQIMPRIRQVDPDLADQLVKKNPTLGASGGKQEAEGGVIANVSSSTPTQLATAQNQLAQSQILGRVQKELDSNPDLAMSDAQLLTNPQLRTLAFAQIAARLAASDPAKASVLLGQTKDNVKSQGDSEDKVAALFARARASHALKDHEGMQAAWMHAVELGAELFQEDLEAHPDMQAYQATCFDELMEGFQFGATVEPDMALGALKAVRNQLLEIYLPIAMAEGIQSRAAVHR
jgi:hypothetical protein